MHVTQTLRFHFCWRQNVALKNALRSRVLADLLHNFHSSGVLFAFSDCLIEITITLCINQLDGSIDFITLSP